ncbi:Uncharacterised protein [uncultured Clostridium sp.]|nr:Uncharacterised protein [uncultured Clostridium sp.]
MQGMTEKLVNVVLLMYGSQRFSNFSNKYRETH